MSPPAFFNGERARIFGGYRRQETRRASIASRTPFAQKSVRKNTTSSGGGGASSRSCASTAIRRSGHAHNTIIAARKIESRAARRSRRNVSTALTGDADCNERLVTVPHIAAREFPRRQFRRPLNSVDRSATRTGGCLQVNPPPDYFIEFSSGLPDRCQDRG